MALFLVQADYSEVRADYSEAQAGGPVRHSAVVGYCLRHSREVNCIPSQSDSVG